MTLGRKKQKRNLHNIFLPTKFSSSARSLMLVVLKCDKLSAEKHYVNHAKLNTIAVWKFNVKEDIILI